MNLKEGQITTVVDYQTLIALSVNEDCSEELLTDFADAEVVIKRVIIDGIYHVTFVDPTKHCKYGELHAHSCELNPYNLINLSKQLFKL